MKLRDLSALLGWTLFGLLLFVLSMSYYYLWGKGIAFCDWLVLLFEGYGWDGLNREIINWGVNGEDGIRLLAINVAVFSFIAMLCLIRTLIIKLGFCLQEYLSYREEQTLVLKRELGKNKNGETLVPANITQYKNNEIFMILLPDYEDKISILGMFDRTEYQSFCYFSLLDGAFWGQSFESRNTELCYEEDGMIKSNSRDLDSKIQAISLFYDNLIAASENKDLKELFKKMKAVYSDDNIKKTIMAVNDKRYSLELAFIGDKVGLLDYEEEAHGIKLCTYLTDHFTWKVFKELYKNNREVFVEAFRMLGKRRAAKYKGERSLLMNALFLLFSSMGVDLVVHGENRKGKEMVLAAIRSGKLQDDGASRIHISVDESFSYTDMENKVPDCSRWAKRGVEEEIGCDKKSLKVVLYDFAITYQLGEIGLCGDVEVENIDEAMMLPGQDKYLEMKALITFPFPCHWYNVYKFYWWLFPDMELMKKLVTKSIDDERMRMKWIGFAPLIYARFFMRCIQRRSRFNTFAKVASYSLGIANILVLVGIIMSASSFGILQLPILVAAVVISYLFSIIAFVIKLGKSFWAKSLQPFVPQWTGDVVVLQNTVAQSPFQGKDMYIKDDSPFQEREVGMDKYVVKGQPKCAVRRKAVDSAVEVPLVFFNVEPKKYEAEAGQIKILHFFLHKNKKNIFYYEVYQIYSHEQETVKSETGNKRKEKVRKPGFVSISFDFPSSECVKIDRIGFRFPESEKKIENEGLQQEIVVDPKKSFIYYFNLHEDELKDTKVLGNPILNREYLTDFFKYNDDYYFSSISCGTPDMDVLIDYLFGHKEQEDSGRKVKSREEVQQSQALYKGAKGWFRETHVVLENGEKYAVVIYELPLNDDKMINEKIERSWSYINGRLSELEVLALQFILIREMRIYIGRKKH